MKAVSVTPLGQPQVNWLTGNFRCACGSSGHARPCPASEACSEKREHAHCFREECNAVMLIES